MVCCAHTGGEHRNLYRLYGDSCHLAGEMRQLCREACEISAGARGVEEADEHGERPDGEGGVEVGGLHNMLDK